MKRLTAIVATLALALPGGAALNLAAPSASVAQVHVRGYTRRDGTYVAPHTRASPNGSRSDNAGSRRGSSSSTPSYESGSAYANCSAARAAGRSNIRRGEPGYGPHLDRDGDGLACER